jgi:hypothetical protein
MPVHKIVMSQPTDQVVRSDVKFRIQVNGEKLGELHISQGNLEWWPKGNKKNKKRMSWTKFAKVFEEEGRTVRE